MTGEGAARADVAWPPEGVRPARDPAFLLVLTHGSGGGPRSADLLAVRDAALALGGAVALVTQPYRVKGHRAPGPPARQDAAWIEVIGALRPAAGPGVPLVQGGRSNGARVACRTASAAGARAVLALAFPLHPPGHPEKSRAAELALAGTDVLVINGSRDPFGIPQEASRIRVVVLDGETHTLSRRPEAAGATAGAWLAGLWGPCAADPVLVPDEAGMGGVSGDAGPWETAVRFPEGALAKPRAQPGPPPGGPQGGRRG